MHKLRTPEDDYWLRLEFRVSGEFPGMAEKRLQYFWCDGFSPREYFLDDPEPRIVGQAWIVEVQAQQKWEFTLFLGRTFPSREAIDWPSLLPAAGITCWVAMDIDGRRIQMDPAAAVPDFELPKKRNAQNRGSA
jgi:hypothetical protein